MAAEMTQAEAIREALQENPAFSAAEVLDYIKKHHPKLEVNEKSLGSAVSGAKKKIRESSSAETPKPRAAAKVQKVAPGGSYTDDEIKLVKSLLAVVPPEKARRLIDLIG